MQLSNRNLLKHVQVTQSEANKEIITEIKKKPMIDSFVNINESIEGEKADDLYYLELQKIEKERQNMMLEIQEKSKKIEVEAYEKGYQDGVAVGKEEGYSQGMERAKSEASYYTEIAQSNLKEANQLIQENIKEQQEALVRFSISLAEKLTEVTIDTNEDVIADKITHFIEELDYPQELIIIRVHASKIESVRQVVKERQALWPHVKISVLKEVGLSAHDYSIEMDDNLMLFDLKNEVTKFLELLLKDDQSC